MKREKPPLARCVCKFRPLAAPGRKVQCLTKGCVFRGLKFVTRQEWNEFIERRVVAAAVNVCRELGITREGV